MKNLIAFFEIPAADFKRAVDFYENVLDVQLSVGEWETEKMACFTDDDGNPVGAISYAPGFDPSASGVLIHFYCDRLEETLRKAVAAGGAVVIPVTKIEAEGKGCFAVIADSEGNHIGLYRD